MRAVRIRLLPSLYLGRDMDVKEDSLMKNRSRVWIFLGYDDFHGREEVESNEEEVFECIWEGGRCGSDEE